MCGPNLPRRILVARVRVLLDPFALELEFVPVNVTALVDGHIFTSDTRLSTVLQVEGSSAGISQSVHLCLATMSSFSVTSTVNF
jgi:hypothetical protein